MAKNGQKWPKMVKNGPKMTQNDVIVRKMTEIDLFHRFEAFLIAQGWLCHFPPVGGSERAKILILPSWKIFDEWTGRNFPYIKIDPKTLFWCIFRQFKDDVFEKNALLCSTISAQKGHFWSPEGLNLAKKLENGVFSVHTIQNLTFWNPNVVPKFFENFGPRDPPWPPPTPPDTPQGAGWAKNGQNAFPLVQYWKWIAKKTFLGGQKNWPTFSLGMYHMKMHYHEIIGEEQNRKYVNL